MLQSVVFEVNRLHPGLSFSKLRKNTWYFVKLTVGFDKLPSNPCDPPYVKIINNALLYH